MAGNQAQRLSRVIARYAKDLPQVQAATDEYVALVTQLLDDAGINYLAVTGRAKSVESYVAKAARRVGGRLVHRHPETWSVISVSGWRWTGRPPTRRAALAA